MMNKSRNALPVNIIEPTTVMMSSRFQQYFINISSSWSSSEPTATLPKCHTPSSQCTHECITRCCFSDKLFYLRTSILLACVYLSPTTSTDRPYKMLVVATVLFLSDSQVLHRCWSSGSSMPTDPRRAHTARDRAGLPSLSEKYKSNPIPL